MSIPIGRAAHDRFPSPFPEGWYFVASHRDVVKAGLIQKTWMGENVVVWCDDDGRVGVAEAYCPHLGSDLGPAAGGCVRQGRIVCPFHGFEFDTAGRCVDTPYALPPRSARLNVFPTRRVHDLIFAWWGIHGRPPQWDLPEHAGNQSGWTDLRISAVRFPGHPQETTENSVDLAHLRYVHGYHNVNRPGRVTVDGPCLDSDFGFRSVLKVAGLASLTLDITTRTRVFGLGCSYVEIAEHSIGLEARLWVMATPVDGNLIDLSLASQMAHIRNPNRKIAGLGFLPSVWRAPVMNRFLAARQMDDVRKDVVIWSRKRYHSRPRLCRSDGEIMAFRSYCAQFYPNLDDLPGAVNASPVAARRPGVPEPATPDHREPATLVPGGL